MTKERSISVFSRDTFLINTIKNEIKSLVFKENDLFSDILIFDKESIESKKFYSQRIINISNNRGVFDVLIKKPFNIRELLHKINNQVDHYNENILEFQEFIVDTKKNIAINCYGKVNLSFRDCLLIKELQKDVEKSKDFILLNILSHSEDADKKIVDNFIYELNKKLKEIKIHNFFECQNSHYRIKKQ